MRGELNRINPTVVEGAEDIFGADDRLIAAGSRPGMWGKRTKGDAGKLTQEQFSKMKRMSNLKKRVQASAETFNAGGCGCGGNTVMNAEGETGCGCGGNTAMGAEAFEARTYRKSPRRGKTPTSKGKTAGKMRRSRKMKQGYNDRMDESMGDGKPMDATRKARRDESKGMEKSMGNRAYSRVQTMDAQGYNDRMDESMGMSNGKESSMKQSMKDRRDESKGMEKSMGNRAYSRVQTMGAEGLYECAECNHWNRNPISGITKCSECGQGKFSKVKNAESFGADSLVVDENMVDLGSVDAFYGGGRKVEVSGDGITPTANPSVDEAFNVGNDVGLDVSDQELMNVNPSVEVNYGADGIGETDVVSTIQNLTSRFGFRVNGLVASAIVLGVAGMAGYHYAKKE